MEISGLAHNHVQAALVANRPTEPPPSSRRVEPQKDTARSGLGGREDSRADVNAAQMRATLRDDENRPAGPPPSFDVSLLEMERDLRKMIARIGIERSMAQDREAVRPTGEQDVPEAAQSPEPGTSAPTREPEPADT